MRAFPPKPKRVQGRRRMWCHKLASFSLHAFCAQTIWTLVASLRQNHVETSLI